MNQATSRELDLEALKKEAKQWLKALRAGDSEAVERWLRARHAGHASGSAATDEERLPVLREVQHVLARELGFASWANLKQHIEDQALAREGHAARVTVFLEDACVDHGSNDDPLRRERAARVLRLYPEVATHSIHTAAVAGDLEAVGAFLRNDPSLANLRGGPQAWPPLLFLCNARLPVPSTYARAVDVLKLLLARGADPNAEMFPGAEYRYTALTGVIGHGEQGPERVPPHPHARAMAEALLEGGIDPNDGQAMYNTSLGGDDPEWLALLLAHGLGRKETARPQHRQPESLKDGQTQLDYLLGNAASRNHLQRAELLLQHGADPNCLHFYEKRPVHEVAQELGHTEFADLLLSHGATPCRLEGIAAFRAACLRRDFEAARRLAEEQPDCRQDVRTLHEAVGRDAADVVEFLLGLGVSPNLADQYDKRALHMAAVSNAPNSARLLLSHGAEPDPRDKNYGSTPLGWAGHCKTPLVAREIAPYSRDLYALVSSGHAERIRELLEAEPELALTRADNGTTPLHLLGTAPPPDEAAVDAIFRLFVAHGADPNAPDPSGKTPAELAEERGLDDVAEMLRAR